MAGDVLRLADDSSSAAEFEGAVLDLLQRSVGFDVAFFSVKGAEASPTVVGVDAALIQRAVRGGPRYYRDLLPVQRAALRARGVAVDTRVLGERRVRKTAYYREVARLVGGRHSLMAYMSLRGRVIAAVMLGRCSRSAFSDKEIAAVEGVVPELGVSRASYGLPLACDPLVVPAPSGALSRLGLLRRSRVLAEERIGTMTVQVRDRGAFREMIAKQGGQELVWTRANLRDPSESGWPYVELLHLAAVDAKARQRALFVGCGGAVAMRQFARLYPGIAIDVVERHDRVVELARAWYDLDGIVGLNVHVDDAASFARRAPSCHWDIVVIDAFDASRAADPLRQPQFFASVHELLRPGGALAVNVIGTLDGGGAVGATVGHLTGVFERIRVVPVMGAGEDYLPDALRNVVIVAAKGSD